VGGGGSRAAINIHPDVHAAKLYLGGIHQAGCQQELQPLILPVYTARYIAPAKVFCRNQRVEDCQSYAAHGGNNPGAAASFLVMKRPAHTFKIGQQVYHHSGGLPGGKRTGPYTIIGIVWQPEGTVRYRIKSPTREQLAEESELKLALSRKETGE
jgi:hypothetical protein